MRDIGLVSLIVKVPDCEGSRRMSERKGVGTRFVVDQPSCNEGV